LMLIFWHFWLLFPQIGQKFIQFSGYTGNKMVCFTLKNNT
jgi:hypothetical protein